MSSATNVAMGGLQQCQLRQRFETCDVALSRLDKARPYCPCVCMFQVSANQTTCDEVIAQPPIPTNLRHRHLRLQCLQLVRPCQGLDWQVLEARS